MKILSLILLLMVSTSCFSWTVFGPKNYDECILENMKGVDTDVGARLVNNSCREKFKEKEVDNSQKWILYNTNNGEWDSYEDKSTISRHGKIVTFDVVNDYNKLQTYNKEQFYSTFMTVEIDCGNLTYRELNIELKSGHMGEGVTVLKWGLMNETKFTKESGTYKRHCSK
jgi:hypothetical protein